MGAEQDLYDRTAARASRLVLASYSTSFGLGAKILDRETRDGIDAVYGLVRIADEVVDTCRGDIAGELLDHLEEETARALRTGWSTNLVVHSFARTARRCGIGHDEVDPFFASMRADLTVQVHDRASFEQYVYGSAEVVGLMCLAVFLNAHRRLGQPLTVPDETLVRGARALGAAFQKINFLRDLRTDFAELGRSYLPGVTPDRLRRRDVDDFCAEIDADLAAARAALPGLPARARLAVAATLAVYDALLARLCATPPAEILRARVRVSDPTKVALAARAASSQLLVQVAPSFGRPVGARTRAGV
ncbi:phytoene/squalene synthase family protein [Cellulosimicrobium marinum]|uniref:phytoene/squalene synthase family protein n=1 Tax=Cellulosimicrobium marinum TaxID=1638992 RepID=UPI001E4EF614|nr:squalene/phytoene synthase family protein [Cellulosimicrobium marinum]MCB7135197.1 squalene/phytoene synthase family protein [Cellulosimicrobium marinum]